MAESENPVKQALKSSNQTSRKAGDVSTSDATGKSQQQAVAPFDQRPAGYWVQLAQRTRAERIAAWKSSVYY